MTDKRSYPYRKSPRLKGYDYAQSGAYFITICTHNRDHLFGHITDGEMTRNPLGDVAYQYWAEIPTHYPMVTLDAFIIMPNHMHGIMVLHDDTTKTIGEIIGAYKGSVTRHARQVLNIQTTIWQRSYHDHMMRDEKAYLSIYQYIHDNPQRWEQDTFFNESS